MRLIDTDQFKNGKNVEAFLDEFFSGRGYDITQTTPTQERVECLGDRLYTGKSATFYVEYKSGIQTHYTGNIFLETISVDTPPQKPGWIYTCQAQFIFYATLLDGEIIIFKPDKLRDEIEGLKKLFKTVSTSKGQNVGYKTHGIIVPVDYAKQHLSHKIITI